MPQPNFQTSFTETYHKTPYAAINPTQSSLSAAGKTILITAGHTGIGFSVAQNFARAGASHIILLARRTNVLQQSTAELSTQYPNTSFHHFTSSITDHTEIRDIFSHIRSEISSDIDVLVTSAAYAAPAADALDLAVSELELSFATNFHANVNLAREFLANDDDDDVREPDKGEKVILDISTMAAHLLMPKIGVYGVSKLAFTQWLAHVQQDVGGRNVRVQSFHPGSVLTDAVRGFGLSEESMAWDDVQLSGQFAVWLASEEARFLKGRFVWANWDVRELVERKGDLERDPELLKVGLMGC